MRELEDKEIFHLFRSRLTATDDFVDDFNSNWADLENRLDEKRRNRDIRFYRIVSGIAAMLLLFFGWQMDNDIQIINDGTIVHTKQNKVSKNEKYKVPKEQHIPNKSELLTKKVQKGYKVQGKTDPFIPNIRSAADHPAERNATTTILAVKNKVEIQLPAQHMAIDSSPVWQLAANPLTHTPTDKNPSQDQNQKNKVVRNRGPRFALAILAAPEINGTNALKSIQTGTNLSIQLSYKISKKLSVNTGVDYSDKPYKTTFGNYRGGKTGWWKKAFADTGLPDDILANCKVLDIPINLNYQLFSKGKNTLIVGSGISSYFMLRENYSFRFSDPMSQTKNLDLKNDNKHILSVLNFNTTFKHNLNNHIGIVVQPYMKLPLNPIGFGQVNLKSAGVAVGLSLNFPNKAQKK